MIALKSSVSINNGLKTVILIIIFIVIFALFSLIYLTKEYSRLEQIGYVQMNDLNEILSNPDGTGKYLLLSNETARKSNAINKILMDSKTGNYNILLVFEKKFNNQTNILYISKNQDLDDLKQDITRNVSVYSVTWRRLKLPEGVAVGTR